MFIFSQLPYLQIASFTNNNIMDTEGINHPLLEHLNLSCKYLHMNLGRITFCPQINECIIMSVVISIVFIFNKMQ